MPLSGILSLWDTCEEFKDTIKNLNDKSVSYFWIYGLKNTARNFFITTLREEINKSYLIITDTQENALQIFQDITTFLSGLEDKSVFLFPSFDVYPYENIPYDPQIIEQRINILRELSENKVKDNIILIADIKALLPKLFSPQTFQDISKELKIGDFLKKEDFLKILLEQNYKSVEIVEKKGEFRARGGILDIFPLTSENPIRIELFGDQVESMRYFNANTQRSILKINSYTLLPPCELIPATSTNYRYSTIFDYLPQDIIILLNELDLIKEKAEEFQEEIHSIYDQFEEKGFYFSPSAYFVFWQEIYDRLKLKKMISFEYFFGGKNENYSLDDIKIRDNGQDIIFEGQEVTSYFGNLELLVNDLKKWQQEKQNIIIMTRDEGRANRLGEILEERGINEYSLGKIEEYFSMESRIYISFGYLNYGFKLPQLKMILITDQEIFGKERNRRYRQPRHRSEPLPSIHEIAQGDYVVHTDHGIGVYQGIINLTVKGITQDYLFIEYAEGDKLYVPIDQFNLVNKYIGIKGKQPTVHRLGGTSWVRTKGKVKKSIQKMALELYNLYLKRKELNGYAFSKDSNWQQELEMSFPFEETYDQLQALSEVKIDMESSKPMERLVCGDVGYGKTEIAVRAAFKAVLDGKQVAVLAPTTILVQQHYDTFYQRMNPFPINLDMLSRFRSKSEQKKIVENLREGKVDIVIGTHRLVQDDIQFKNLGLLIIDEEQRFGVVHKERIKSLKENIDSLTLTATPIPRTLHMSLVGVRDLSVINTPPEDRFPIATYICQRDDKVIFDAIRRELERGGQVFFVHNRVRGIQKVAQDLNRLIPQAKIGIAHGQMAEEQLEEIMIDFLEKRYDILICTTIIEIGLDIPNVNTIIIDDAFKFGLSQLYQLRGRVGRTDRRAYAYFLYPSYRSISETAKKRLSAIKEFSELGSGFKLAMRDLEIRGAGNLLGKEQHGFVGEIGFNLYCRFLEEAIKELREEDKEKKKDLYPVIDLKIDAFLPKEYISNLEHRILFYKRLSDINDLESLEKIKEELGDRYGVYPKEVKNLLEIIYLKTFLKKLKIASLIVKEELALIKYPSNINIGDKLIKLPTFFQERIINDDKKLIGILKISLAGINSREILRFLKEFIISLSK